MVAIENIFYGFPFVWKFAKASSGKLPISIINDELKSQSNRSKSYKTRFYIPSNNRLPKTILLIHGMSVLGIEDNRLVELAQNLCCSGFSVITPEFEELKHLKIQYDTIENIIDVLKSLNLKSNLIDTENIGFFSISFTGGLGLISATDKDVSGLIRAILVIGGYSDFSSTACYVLEDKNSDEYGRLIFLYNFIDLVLEKSENLKDVLYESAVDNAFRRYGKDSVANKLIQDLNIRDKEIYQKIWNQDDYSVNLGREIFESISTLAQKMSPIEYVERINAPISLLHGKDDRVIPETETIKLSEKMKKMKKEYVMEITGLLSHGDRVPLYKQVADLPGITNAFGYFFKKLLQKR
ncbi:MAG: hypothetical protein H7A23_25225 [Leptospiraceae bacterium]|nr:hypothetical protein [Leptospiraceae bacterium]MCP5497870.1 hypothetical protein [Leptospiraceae bacterium]